MRAGGNAGYDASGGHQAGVSGQLNGSAQEVWEGGRKRGKRLSSCSNFAKTTGFLENKDNRGGSHKTPPSHKGQVVNGHRLRKAKNEYAPPTPLGDQPEVEFFLFCLNTGFFTCDNIFE